MVNSLFVPAQRRVSDVLALCLAGGVPPPPPVPGVPSPSAPVPPPGISDPMPPDIVDPLPPEIIDPPLPGQRPLSEPPLPGFCERLHQHLHHLPLRSHMH